MIVYVILSVLKYHTLSFASVIGLGKDFSVKLTILLHDLHIEILTVVEYNLYA